MGDFNAPRDMHILDTKGERDGLRMALFFRVGHVGHMIPGFPCQARPHRPQIFSTTNETGFDQHPVAGWLIWHPDHGVDHPMNYPKRGGADRHSNHRCIVVYQGFCTAKAGQPFFKSSWTPRGMLALRKFDSTCPCTAKVTEALRPPPHGRGLRRGH